MTIDAVIAALKRTGETAAKANIAAEAKGILGNVDFKFILALKVSRTGICKFLRFQCLHALH